MLMIEQPTSSRHRYLYTLHKIQKRGEAITPLPHPLPLILSPAQQHMPAIVFPDQLNLAKVPNNFIRC